MWRRRVGVLPTVARPVGSLRSPPPRRCVAGRLASLPPPPLLLAAPRLCTTLEQVRLVQVVQRDGVIQRYWVSHRVLVAPSPVVALSLREALPLGVRGSFRCSRCRFGLVLPLFLALLRRCRRCRSSTIVYWAKSVLRCRAHRYFCCSLSLRPNGRTPTGAVCRSWGPAHSLLARGGPRPLLRFGCSLRSHRPTVRAASAHRCQASPAVFFG